MNKNQIAEKMYGKYMTDLNPSQRDTVESIQGNRDLEKLLED